MIVSGHNLSTLRQREFDMVGAKVPSKIVDHSLMHPAKMGGKERVVDDGVREDTAVRSSIYSS